MLEGGSRGSQGRIRLSLRVPCGSQGVSRPHQEVSEGSQEVTISNLLATEKALINQFQTP